MGCSKDAQLFGSLSRSWDIWTTTLSDGNKPAEGRVLLCQSLCLSKYKINEVLCSCIQYLLFCQTLLSTDFSCTLSSYKTILSSLPSKDLYCTPQNPMPPNSCLHVTFLLICNTCIFLWARWNTSTYAHNTN